MATRIGDSRLVFGASDEVWGYIQNLKEEVSAEKVEARNGLGKKVAAEFYNVGEKKVSGSFLYLTGGSGPDTKVGDATGCTLTDVTGTIHIDKASKARQMGNWMVVDFEGTYYPHLVNS